jgi:hypothetical protein
VGLRKWYAAQLEVPGSPSFEIVYVTADPTPAQFAKAVAGMPWAVLPYEAEAARETAERLYGSSVVPTLALVRRDGSVVSTDVLAWMSSNPAGFPWDR